MADQFEEKPLFGGAIIGAIPQGWLDASDLRQVPDHQEIFLSPTTLSNLIVEINEYVPKQQALSSLSSAPAAASPQDAALPQSGGAHVNADTEGIAAALYHLRDLCDEGDTMDVINPPHRVQLKHFASVKDVSAFAGLVKYTTPKKQRGAVQQQQQQQQQVAFTSIDASGAGSSSTTGPTRSTHSCHFLLVRLPEKETDLLIFVNVPHDEFDLQGDPRALAREETVAGGLVGRFMETLDVRDWNLFG